MFHKIEFETIAFWVKSTVVILAGYDKKVASSDKSNKNLRMFIYGLNEYWCFI